MPTFYAGQTDYIDKLNELNTVVESSFLSGLTYKGAWNASSGAYPIVGSLGMYYKVAVAGTVNSIYYEVEDAIIHNGNGWDKFAHTDSVATVNNRAGRVTLNSDDVGLSQVNNTSDANKPISLAQAAAINLKAPISSPEFNGIPKAPTALLNTSSTQIATTAFVVEEVLARTTPISHIGSGAEAHAIVIPDGIAGFMLGVDKSKLDTIEPNAQANVPTNISEGIRTATSVSINSSTGSAATLSTASISTAGLMSSADKIKLDSIVGTGGGNADLLTGLPIVVTALTAGDLLVFSGTQWVNQHKTTLVDGGNF